jgi:hypothetical protein
VDVVFVKSWFERNSEARCKLLFEDDGKRRSTLNAKTARPGPCCFFFLLGPLLFLESGGRFLHSVARLYLVLFSGRQITGSARGEVNDYLELLQ